MKRCRFNEVQGWLSNPQRRLIPHTAANGLPLAAEQNERIGKTALLDVGMAHALWNTPAGERLPQWEMIAPAIRGMVSEQAAAQQLLLVSGSFTREGRLFHRRREGGRPGEIDYLLELHGRIVPVEVKSSAAMKGLRQFMRDKGLTLAVRLDTNPPSLHPGRARALLAAQPSPLSLLPSQ